MTVEEMVHMAHLAGANAGQIAIAEYILKEYREDIPPRLATFLQTVLDSSYKEASVLLGKPAEDVALKVNEIIGKVA